MPAQGSNKSLVNIQYEGLRDLTLLIFPVIAGVTLEEIQTLNMGTQRAQGDVSAMLADLKGNTTEHTAFMRELSKLQIAAAKEFT